MHFCATFLKRIPVRAVAPTLLAVLALAGFFGNGTSILWGMLDRLGSYWG